MEKVDFDVDRAADFAQKSIFSLHNTLQKELDSIPKNSDIPRGDVVLGVLQAIDDLNVYATSGIPANKLAGEVVPPSMIEGAIKQIEKLKSANELQSETRLRIRAALMGSFDMMAEDGKPEINQVNIFEHALNYSANMLGRYTKTNGFIEKLQELNLITETEKATINMIREDIATRTEPEKMMYIYKSVGMPEIVDAVLNTNVRTNWEFRHYLIDKEKEAGYWYEKPPSERTLIKKELRANKAENITKLISTEKFLDIYEDLLVELQNDPTTKVDKIIGLFSGIDDARRYLWEVSHLKLAGKEVSDEFLANNVYNFINAIGKNESKAVSETRVKVRGKLFEAYDNLLDILMSKIEIRKHSDGDMNDIVNGIDRGLEKLVKYVTGVGFVRKLRNDGVISADEEKRLIELRNETGTSKRWLSLVIGYERRVGILPLTDVYKKALK